MLKYKIDKISNVDISQLSDFYKKTFYERYKSLTNNWKWWYRAGYNEHEPIILSLDNKIIGQAGLLPVDLIIEEKKVPAIWFVDFAILPEFRGKGFGQILTKEWMKICPNQITFCNNHSLRIFKKFGWSNNLSIKRLARPINLLKFIPLLNKFNLTFLNKTLIKFNKKKFSNGFSINPYEITKNFKVLEESFKIKKNIKSYKNPTILRDEKWLYWRIMECPYKKDINFFEYKNNFAITHIYYKKNIKRLNILYTYYTEDSKDDELLALIIDWATNNNIDLVWLINGEKKYQNIFPKLFCKPLNFAAYSSDKKVSEILQNGLFDPQGIDSDIDSNLYIE